MARMTDAMNEQSFDAIYYPYIVCLDETELKLLLLLYDRVFFLPNDTHLNEGFESSITKRWSFHDATLEIAFATPQRAYRALMYSSEESAWDDPMRRLMATYEMLESKSICIPLRDERFEDSSSWHPLQHVVDEDLNDSTFVDRVERARHPRLTIPRDDRMQIRGGGCSIRPVLRQQHAFAALCSERINTALAYASESHVIPVAPNPLFASMLNAKLRRQLVSEPEHYGLASMPARRRSRLNTLSWSIATEIVSRNALATRSVADILKYREATAEAAQRFRMFLRQVEAELREDPWSEKALGEIRDSITRRVLPEVQKARDSKRDVWRKLFGDAATSLLSADVIAAAASAPILIHLMPGIGYGALIGAAGVAFARTLKPLVSAWHDDTARRRNAMFFLLNF